MWLEGKWYWGGNGNSCWVKVQIVEWCEEEVLVENCDCLEIDGWGGSSITLGNP